MSKKVLAAAVAVAFVMGVNLPVLAKTKMEPCYGIAKKGKNDCGTATHACAGQATTNNDPNEWIYVKKGTCKAKGGHLKKEAATQQTGKKS